MTKEEKRAIEISKISLCVAHKYDKRNMIYNTASLETLLDLLEKQQKEIKKYKKFIEDKTKIGKDIQTFINKDYVEQEYISKDKIRDKIKEYREQRIKLADGHFFDNPDNTSNDFALFIGQEVLKELLGE